MKRVIVESPFRGENLYQTERNRRYALECMKDSMLRGEAPFLSHLIYTQVLNDKIPEERNLGIEIGLKWGEVADLTAVYTDNGISEGMKIGVADAQKHDRPVEYRVLPVIDKNNNQAHGVKLNSLLTQVSGHFGFHPELLKRGDRHRFIADARNVYCALAKDMYPEFSLNEIGKAVNRSHSTVMHAIRQVRNTKEVRDKYNEFCETKKIQLCLSDR